MRQLAEFNREAFQAFGQVMGRGLAFKRGVHRQNDLVDAALGNAADELINAEIGGSHALQRRWRPPSTW